MVTVKSPTETPFSLCNPTTNNNKCISMQETSATGDGDHMTLL
jgi:hypothetical protein